MRVTRATRRDALKVFKVIKTEKYSMLNGCSKKVIKVCNKNTEGDSAGVHVRGDGGAEGVFNVLEGVRRWYIY